MRLARFLKLNINIRMTPPFKNVVGAATLLIMDAMWLYLFMATRYGELIHGVQKRPMHLRIGYAFAAYAIMLLGLFAVVNPGPDVATAASRGAVFGIVLYGVYNCTLLAVLSDWSPGLALADTLWGGILFATASAAMAITGS